MTSPFPRRWRILRDPPALGAWNMAMDVALARCLGPDEGVLRIYRWSRPTLSLGRNQPARDRYDPAAADGLGAQIVRRPTGGRELVHDRELTYAVTLPLEGLRGLRQSYRVLNGALLDALRSLGVAARMAEGNGRAPRPGSGPCFLAPAQGEVEVEGRKLVGSAQARIGKVLLQHGSLLLAPPSVALEALRGPVSAPVMAPASAPVAVSSGGVTLTELLPVPPGFPDVAAAVEAAFAGTLGGEWRRDVATGSEREVAVTLLPHYESFSWTWRR